MNSLPCSQKPATSFYPELCQSGLRPSSRPCLGFPSHLFLGFPSRLIISFRSPHQNPACTSPVAHPCYMLHTSLPSLFGHPDNICWPVQIMQLLNMQFSPVFAASCPGVQIPSSAPYFQTPSASYIRDEVSHPYKKHAQFFSFVGRFSPATAEAASLSGIVEHTHTHTG
jgi:hypothetical protein